MIGIKGIATKPIIDANANPEDVALGKIFYNNSGKQTGTGMMDYAKSYTVKISTIDGASMKISSNTVDFYYPNPETKSLEKLYVMASDGIIIRDHVSVELPEFNQLVGIGFNDIRYNLMAAGIVICRTKPSNNYTMPEPIMFLSDGRIGKFSNIVAIFETGTYTFYYE